MWILCCNSGCKKFKSSLRVIAALEKPRLRFLSRRSRHVMLRTIQQFTEERIRRKCMYNLNKRKLLFLVSEIPGKRDGLSAKILELIHTYEHVAFFLLPLSFPSSIKTAFLMKKKCSLQNCFPPLFFLFISVQTRIMSFEVHRRFRFFFSPFMAV